MKSFIQRILINFIAKHLFNLITEDDVLRIVGQRIIHRGIALTEEQKRSIISEAKTLKDLLIWKLLVNDMKFMANKNMYFKSSGVNDLMGAKFVLWTVDIMEKKIDSVANMRPDKSQD